MSTDAVNPYLSTGIYPNTAIYPNSGLQTGYGISPESNPALGGDSLGIDNGFTSTSQYMAMDPSLDPGISEDSELAGTPDSTMGMYGGGYGGLYGTPDSSLVGGNDMSDIGLGGSDMSDMGLDDGGVDGSAGSSPSSSVVSAATTDDDGDDDGAV